MRRRASASIWTPPDAADAELVHDIARTLVWDPAQGLRERSDTRLMPDESIVLSLALPAQARGRVEVRVEPDAFYHDVVYPLLLETLDRTRHAEARRMIREARQAAGRSGFVLYRARCGPWSGGAGECDLQIPRD
jgi:hypothetical protein